ncbi:hypothetical protein PPACK8108_LOCUS9859 [Phakopsora pachyrhizi]|uniref:Uncharacterized protein n=1 Tax=Phakopsora pachyrhizi TaxID=170000 RepID=A0AAV0AZP6_PHAPC|nr:hypothetical protein PPACK8108_LOCUS9859 [Phakopsora pachyrhizi]
MHNSSSSSASSSTDSWDFDPDLIIPDDSKKDTEDSTVSSSIESALISSNSAYSTLNTTTTTTTTDLNHSSSSQSAQSFGQQVKSSEIIENMTFFNLVVLNLRNEVKRLLKIIKPQQVQLIDCFKDPCLQQQLPHQKSNRTPINNTNLSLLISSSSHQEINNSLDSISLRLSPEHQSTIKALGPSLGEKDETRHDSEGIRDDLKNSRYVDDPVCDLLQEPLALSSQLTKKGKPIKKPSGCCSSSSSSISKPNSLVSLIGLDLDFLEDKEQLDLKKCSSILSSSSSSSSSNQKRPTQLGQFPGQQQAHSQPHAEDDINKGFFDDIEFPPKFGIPNNLHPASTPSNPSLLPSSKLHKPIESFRSLEDEKDQKDQTAKSKENIRTSRGKSKVRLQL